MKTVTTTTATVIKPEHMFVAINDNTFNRQDIIGNPCGHRLK